MVDNIEVTAGSGTSIATEDVSGVQHQKVKIEFGTDGVATLVSASDPLPVTTTGLATSAKQDTLLTELQLKADLTETQPVSLTSTTITGTVAVTDNSGSLTIDAPVGTPAFVRLSDGAAAISTLPVSIATAPVLVAGSALIGKVGIDQVTANANEVVTKTGSVTAATLSAETTKVIGTVNIAAAQTLATVTTVGAVTSLTNALPAGTNNIGDVDVLSIIPGTGATNLGKIEDAAHTTGDVGVMMLGVANQNSLNVSSTDGDYTPISVTRYGAVAMAARDLGSFVYDDIFTDNGGLMTTGDESHDSVDAGKPNKIGGKAYSSEPAAVANADRVNAYFDTTGHQHVKVDSAPTTAVTFTGSTDVATQTTLASLLTSSQLIDDAIYTDDTSTHSTGTSKGALIMGAATPTDTAVNANDIGAIGMTNNRAMYVSVQDALPAGTNAIGKLSANSGVDIGDIDVTSIIPGTGATNLGKAEDVAHASGDVGVASLARRIDTLATSADTSGDYAVENQTAEGAIWATLAPTTTSGLSIANFTSGDTYTALTNTSQVIKASAGLLYGYYIYNPNSAATYVQIYNVASASVTVGTTTALMVFCIPATSGANLALPYGITFSNAGWSCAATTTGGGNTAPATALEAMIFYK